MSRSLFPTSRLPSRVISSVTSQCQCIRTFASTQVRDRQAATLKYFHSVQTISSPAKLWDKKLDDAALPPMPPYPYGPNYTFPEADTGLYGGAKVQSGNKISKGRNKGKALRRWYPNVRLEKVRSNALEQEFTIKITAACMRTINKCGGLDNYLMGTSSARMKELGLLGWRLRWRVMTSKAMQQKFQKEREELGLTGPNPFTERFEDAIKRPEVETEILRLQTEAWEKLREKNQRFEAHVSRLVPKRDQKVDKYEALFDNNERRGNEKDEDFRLSHMRMITLMDHSPKTIGYPPTE